MSAIVRPNAARCFTYSTAYISAPSASPMPRAATIGRIELRPSIASRNPPTSPTTFAAGTRTSSSISSPVSTPRTPILSSVRPTETPGADRSTMKHEMSACLRESAGPVLANTQYQSACTTPDIQHFVPVSTQSSPSRTALVRMPMTSLPACGSESPKPARMLARSRRRARTAASAPRCPAISTGPVGRRVSSSISAAVFEYFATSSIAIVRPRIPAPGSAVLLGDHEAEQARVAEQVEEVLRVLGGGVDLAGPGRDLVLRQLADGGLELEELRREVERHRSASLPAPVAETGRLATPHSAHWPLPVGRMLRDDVPGGSGRHVDDDGWARRPRPDRARSRTAPDGDDIVVIPDAPASTSHGPCARSSSASDRAGARGRGDHDRIGQPRRLRLDRGSGASPNARPPPRPSRFRSESSRRHPPKTPAKPRATVPHVATTVADERRRATPSLLRPSRQLRRRRRRPHRRIRRRCSPGRRRRPRSRSRPVGTQAFP